MSCIPCLPEDCCRGMSVTPVLIAPMSEGIYCNTTPVCIPCLPRCQRPPRECKHKRDDDDRPCNRRSRSPQEAPAPRNSCPTCCQVVCKPVRTKYVIPCYRYEDGRIVEKLPVTAFKRNGLQDRENSAILGASNFIARCPQDVSIECEVCETPVKKGDPAKVPTCNHRAPLGSCFMKKQPIEANQPTLLMKRACELAVGQRQRSNPYVSSSCTNDRDVEERRLDSEDEQVNCCYHCEKKCIESPKHRVPTNPVQSCPQCQYQDCVLARAIEPTEYCCIYK